MVDVTLRQLEYLSTIARTGTLVSAARELHITPGSLSAAITDLERGLGLQVLLRRRSKGAGLTPAGQQLIGNVEEVLRAKEALMSAAGTVRGELVGPLRLGCFTALSPWIVPPVIDHFSRRFSAVDVVLVEDSSVALQSMLVDGSLDACYLYRQHISSALNHVTVAPMRLNLVLHAAHDLARRPSVRLAELGAEPAALLSLRPAADMVESMTSAAGFHPNVRWRSKSVETIRSIVGRGLGYSLLMGRPLGDMSYEGHPLAYRRFEDDLPENSIELVYPPGGTVNAKVRELVEFSSRQLRHEIQGITADASPAINDMP